MFLNTVKETVTEATIQTPRCPAFPLIQTRRCHLHCGVKLGGFNKNLYLPDFEDWNVHRNNPDPLH